MTQIAIDVLCVGQATYDLIFQVPHHPAEDEKMVASHFWGCGGGPASNAAITVTRAGGSAAFAGYVSNDLFGQRHWAELQEAGVVTEWIVRGASQTPMSTVLVKPNGKRALVNYRSATQPLAADAIDFSLCKPKVMLFDGHEPLLSPPLALWAKQQGILTIMDAGSMHPGTQTLMGMVDHLVSSKKFARQATHCEDPLQSLDILLQHAPIVVITLGEQGLIWGKRDGSRGQLPAHPVTAVDTTGAGDVFHGAYSLCLAQVRDWDYTLAYASAAAALSCIALGARPSIPGRADTEAFLAAHA